MIAALKFDDFVAARVASCQANSTHCGFGARADHAYFFYRGQALLDELGKFYFSFGGGTKRKSFFSGCLYCSNYIRMGMTQNSRAPRANIINIFFIICVPNPWTLGFFNKRWTDSH